MRTSRLIARLGTACRCLFAGLALAGLPAACSETPTTGSPSQPSPPDPQAPQAPAPTPQTSPALTGVVFETTAQARRPISGAHIVVVDLVAGPYDGLGWSEVLSDANGRFSIADLFRGSPVKVTAYVGSGQGLWNQSGLFQACAVHPTLTGDTTADIELVGAGIRPAMYGSPTLSGVVFETSQGRRPVAGAPILYSSNGHDGADVYMRTDANGRYNFCRLPIGRGYLLAGCARAVTPGPGLGTFTRVDLEVRGDTVRDVDVDFVDQ